MAMPQLISIQLSSYRRIVQRVRLSAFPRSLRRFHTKCSVTSTHRCCNSFFFVFVFFCSSTFTFCVSPIMPQPHFACYSPAIVNNITNTATLQLCVHACLLHSGRWTLSQLSWCDGRVTPGVQAWTSCQFIADRRETNAPTLTVTPRDNLELPVSLVFMSVPGSRRTWMKLIQAQQALHTQRSQL